MSFELVLYNWDVPKGLRLNENIKSKAFLDGLVPDACLRLDPLWLS